MTKANGFNDYFEEGYTANEEYNYIKQRVLVDLFHNQEKFLYMIGELGKGRKPMLRENAEEYIQMIIDNNFADITSYMLADIISDYHFNGDIDIPTNIADDINDYSGYNEEDEYYIHGVDK